MVVRIGQAPAGEKPDLHDVEPCGGHADERRRTVAAPRRAGQAEPHVVVDRKRNVGHASVPGRAVREGVREPARLERRHPELGRIEGSDQLLAKGSRGLVDHRLRGSREESREHHEAERQCDLGDDQRGSQSRVAKAAALCALFELAGRRTAEHDPRGHEPGRQGDPERERDCEEQHAPVDAHEYRYHRLHPDEGQEDEPDRQTHADQHARERLEGEQPHQPGAGCPERQPNGELARLFRDAGQVQVGHVRAADREHDERQRQQRNHERDDLDRGVARPESVSAHARSGVGACAGLRRGDACRRDRQLALDIRGREAGFHASDDFEQGGVERWATWPLRREGQGYPGLHALRLVLPRVGEGQPVEARRRHADDRERAPAEQHGTANRVVAPVEMGAPEVVRHDGHRRCRRAVVVGREESAAHRRGAKDPEEIAGDEGATDRDGSVAARRGHLQLAFRANRLERRVRRQFPHDGEVIE